MCWWACACHIGVGLELLGEQLSVSLVDALSVFSAHHPPSWVSVLTLVCPFLKQEANVFQTHLQGAVLSWTVTGRPHCVTKLCLPSSPMSLPLAYVHLPMCVCHFWL